MFAVFETNHGVMEWCSTHDTEAEAIEAANERQPELEECVMVIRVSGFRQNA